MEKGNWCIHYSLFSIMNVMWPASLSSWHLPHHNGFYPWILSQYRPFPLSCFCQSIFKTRTGKETKTVWWLNETVPHRLRCLNTWFPVGCIAWLGLGSVLARGSMSPEVGFESLKPHSILVFLSLLPAYILRCELSYVPAVCSQNSLPWWMESYPSEL